MQINFNLLNLNLVSFIVVGIAVVFAIVIIIPIVKSVVKKIKDSKIKKKEIETKKKEKEQEKEKETQEIEKKERFFEEMANKLENYEPLNAKSINFEEENFSIPLQEIRKPVLIKPEEEKPEEEKSEEETLEEKIKSPLENLSDTDIDDEIRKFLESEDDDMSTLINFNKKNNNLFNSERKENGNVYSDMFTEDKAKDGYEVTIEDELADVYSGDGLKDLDKLDDEELKIIHDKDDEEYDKFHEEIINRRNKRMNLLSFTDRKKIQSLYEEVKNCSKRVQAIVIMDILNKKKF